MAWSILINSNKRVSPELLKTVVERLPIELRKPIGGPIEQKWGFNCSTEIHFPHNDLQFKLRGAVFNQAKAGVMALHMKRVLEGEGHRITIHPISQE